jgi:hypothetical protein
MNPLQVLKEYSKKNPQSAALLFGTVACFAAVAEIIEASLKSRPNFGSRRNGPC